MKNKWTKIILENAIKLHENGLTFAEIAIKLNRTEKAVKIKLGRIGLKQNKPEYYEIIICLNCGEKFKSLKNKTRKFCSSNCAATHNNKIRIRNVNNDEKSKINRERYKKKKNNNCLNCGKLVYNKYCSSTCRMNYNIKIIFNMIENDEPIKIGNNSTNNRYYKKYLIHKHGEKCMECGWNKMNPTTNKIPIELEHIDGNSENNLLSNLKLLCPNCHSLTSTYKALNKGNGRFYRMKRYKNGKSF